jgi:DNA polymerase III epsilon subunit-like protein
MKSYKDKLLAFVDSECTGLDPTQHELIELGVILYDYNKDEIIREWETKIAPRHIETAQEEALEINGYTNNPKSYRANLRNSLVKLNKLVDDCMLVGQNIAFDVAFIETAMTEFDIKPKYDRRKLELMSMAWFYVKDQSLNGLSLRDLCSHFNISNTGAHGALVDCRRTLGVYRSLAGLYRWS